MPELPEVELVSQSLNKLISRREIAAAELLRERLAPFNSPSDFAVKLKNSKINFVHRRGKHVLFDLDNDQTLLTHLRMSGRFLLLTAERENPKFTHAVFYFSDESRLVFSDQRHFGFMKLVETENLLQTKEIKNLAPEPLSPEFSREYFRAALKTSRRSLKEFLLDQTKVCGLGNIYAAEAMFLARANPQMSANSISSKKADILLEKIRFVISQSIAYSSTLNVDPENIDGSYYNTDFEKNWLVYDREKMPCSNCNTEIKRLKQAGRSSYFCPTCQK